MNRSRALSESRLRSLRRELERSCSRYPEQDPRHYAAAAALLRMDGGSYGTCDGCGDEIPFSRLSVLPETRYCVTCSTRVLVS